MLITLCYYFCYYGIVPKHMQISQILFFSPGRPFATGPSPSARGPQMRRANRRGPQKRRGGAWLRSGSRRESQCRAREGGAQRDSRAHNRLRCEGPLGSLFTGAGLPKVLERRRMVGRRVPRRALAHISSSRWGGRHSSPRWDIVNPTRDRRVEGRAKTETLPKRRG